MGARQFVRYHGEHLIAPSQQAANGALDIFVEGCRKNDPGPQIFGLSALGCSTQAQIQIAIPLVAANQHVTRAEIEAMFAR
ncbi:MAG: hypothetical protein ABIZ49_05965 [Opitutaceae bacterium]